ERGEKTLVAPAIYVSINSAPAELAVLVDAARRSGGKIALLPEGEARIERLAERDLGNFGQRTHVVMYAVTGLDFSPVYVWLDERDKFFASLNPWITVISAGWEKAAQSLEMVQDQNLAGPRVGTRRQANPFGARRHRVHACARLRCEGCNDS